MTLSSGDLNNNSEALSFAVIPVLVCRELIALGYQSWESIMLYIGLGINLTNFQSMEGVQVCDGVFYILPYWLQML